MENTETLDKRTMILDAAFKVFLAYGFKRTTMADIADAAGISRPALYLEFKNKADIYRAGFVSLLERKFRDVDAILEREGPIVDRIIGALNAAIVTPMREIAQTPHGHELFEVRQELAGDLGDDWNTVLERSLERACAKAADAGDLDLARHDLSASDLARLLVMSVDGIKKRMCDSEQMESDFRLLVELMVGPLAKHG